jgi:hypothetical protein
MTALSPKRQLAQSTENLGHVMFLGVVKVLFN